MEQIVGLQNKIESLKKEHSKSHSLILFALVVMIMGGGLCFGAETIEIGTIALILGLVLFISGSIKAGTCTRNIQKVKNELATLDPAQFNPVKKSVGHTIANVILFLVAIAIIGIGGCFAFFGLMSVGGAF